MKKFKTTLAAILAACALLNITGCAENSSAVPDLSGSDTNNSDNSAPGDNDGSGANSLDTGKSEEGGTDKRAPGTNNSTDSAETVKTQYAPITLTDSNTENSIRLFDAISEGLDNDMFSPLSLNMALGLLEAGADGETKAQIDSYLQTENYTDLAAEYIKFAKEERSNEKIVHSEWDTTPASVLEIANSLWADDLLPIKDDYKQRIGGKFDAEIRNLDFSAADDALNEINGWISDKTHEMIPKALGAIDPETLAVLINSVYFESNWTGDWFIDEAKKESFTLPDGTVKQLPLMWKGGSTYFENDHASAFSCTYRNGVEFIGILPKDDGDFTLEGLDIPSLLESRTYDYDVSMAMPRLKFDTSFVLGNALEAAGLENIFDVTKANLSGISDVSLYVTEVIQKTSLELDENGTKAAAVTIMPMTGGGGEEVYRETKTVRLDRPFAFMIYDKTKDQILFVGKVTNP